MSPRTRSLAACLLVLGLFLAGAPRVVISCVPGASCPMSADCAELAPAAATGTAIGQPDCCRRTETKSAPGAIERAARERMLPLATLPPAFHVALAGPADPRLEHRPRALPPPPRRVPLYELHSLLLI